MKKKIILLVTLICCVASALYAQRAVVKGMVQDDSQQPLEHVVINVLDYNLQTVTDEHGTFFLSVPENSTLKISFQLISHKDSILTLRLKPKETLFVIITLPATGERLQTVNIRGNSESGYIRVDPKLTFQLPSPNGGVESLIKMMPGTSSTNELSSQYNVRGGNFDENLIYVNDIQIYRPFLIRNAQQEGLSFVNTDLTGNVKFSAGGFEAKYGDKMSSVLDVQYKEPTQYGGSVTGSFLGASAHVEGKVDSSFSFLVGIRYKSNAYLLKSMETSGDYKPNFFDTQILLNWKLSSKFSISLLGNLSRNSYIYQPQNRETTFGSIQNVKRLTVYFDGQEVDRYENYLGGLTFSYYPNHNNMIKLILSSYYAKESETYDIQSQYWLKDIEADLGDENNVAQEVSVRGVGTYLEHARNYLSSLVSAADLRGEHKLPYFNTLSWGIKAQNEIIHDKISEWTMNDSSGYTLPNLQDTVGIAIPLTDTIRWLTFGEDACLNSYNALCTFRFTGFIQDSWKIDGDSLTRYMLNAGVRFHYWTYSPKEFTVSPRLAFIYRPRWKHDWEFSLRTGIYYQPAFYREMRYSDGTLNPNIKSQCSYQVVAGSEYNFNIWHRPFKFITEAYYKYMNNLISYTVDNVRIEYSGKNDAVGYATGVDMKLSGEFVRGLESWFSVSLMKTMEDLIGDYYYDENGNKIEPGYLPRPTDQRVSFNLFFQDHVPGYPKLRVHLNFVFASGLPYGAPTAEPYQRTLRTPWYRRVDLGFSYMFLEQSRDRMRNHSKFLRAIKNAGVYVEVFNLLDINNVSSYFWVTDVYNYQFSVPNYLTGRLINLKLAVEF